MASKKHQQFLDTALARIAFDSRVLGVAAGGSWISGEIDKFSDIDLVIVVDPTHFNSVFREMEKIAQSLGPCLASFPGDHLGLPNLLICLFDDPLQHVDMKFLSLEDFRHRIENPEVLWEREGALTKVIESSKPTPIIVNLQWMEDRFWIWIHYAALRLGRGEIFEVLDVLNFLRTRVLGPLACSQAGRPVRGVRRLEMYCPNQVPGIEQTVATYDAHSCEQALRAAAKLYIELRESKASEDLRRNRRAEMATLRALHEVSEHLPR